MTHFEFWTNLATVILLVPDSTGPSAASAAAGFASPAPAAGEQPATAAKEPHFDRDESNEAPSEAELELLQALRSIK